MEDKKVNTAEYIKVIKESPEKKRSYIFFGFSIIVTIILIVFAIRPTIATITRINTEIRTKTRTNNLLEQKINALSELDREYLDNKEGFDDLELIFPAGDNRSLLLANIDSIATRNGYSLSSVRFDRYRGDYVSNTRVLQPRTMSFNVRGRRANIIGLIRDIEGLPMYPVLESLSYSFREGEELSSFTLTVRIYGVDNDNFYK